MPYLIHDEGTVTDLTGLGDGEFMLLGSTPACDVRITGAGVARKHCRILNVRSLFYIQSFSAKNAVAVNNEPIEAREQVLNDNDAIRIGESRTMRYRETLQSAADDEQSAANMLKAADGSARQQIKQKINNMLLQRINLKTLGTSKRADEEIKRRARQMVKTIIDEMGPEIEGIATREELYKETIDEALGLGPLEDLLADDSITEIMCNGPNRIFVERSGKIELTDSTFLDEEQMRHVIEKIVGPLGRRIDESSPLVDARLPDGSRVNAVIAPVALDGPTLNIRKFSKKQLVIDDIIAFGSMNETMGRFLRLAVENRQNIIISGGTGSGKTTLLNVVSSFIPATERIVTIEDSAELRLEQIHVARLEARPPNIEGRGEISIRDLVRNSLRMRPDRVIVGECRGGESLDMLQAMNTGHDGSLTTVHANSPHDVIARLETMVLMSGMDLPLRAIIEQIVAAVDIICHQARISDGSRKVVSIAEITGYNGDQVELQDIYAFKQTGLGEDGKVQGRFVATGHIPSFVHKLQERGIAVDLSLFGKND